MIRVARAGSELGEFSSADVQAGLQSGRFLYSDYYCEQGDSEWLPLSLYIPEVKKKITTHKKVQFQPTNEQEAICANLPGPGELMLINAYAGSGKTETLRLIAERHPMSNLLIFATIEILLKRQNEGFPKIPGVARFIV